RPRGGLLAGTVGVVMGEGELALQAWNRAGQPEQLGPCIQGAEILVGAAALEIRTLVVDEGVAPGIVQRQAPSEVLRQGTRDSDGGAPRVVVADFRLV